MKSLLRLGAYLRPYRLHTALSMVVLLAITASEMVFPRIIQEVIDVGLETRAVSFLINAALIVIGLGVVKSLLSFGERFLTEWIAHNVAYDLRNRLYNHIQHQPFTYHDHTQSGQLISRCIEDVRSIQGFTGHGLIELMRVILLVVGISVVLFASHPGLAVIALLPMLPMVLVTTSFGKKIGKLFLEVDKALGELSSRLQENVSGAQVVRAFAREPYEIDRFEEANRILFKSRVQVYGEWSKIMPTTTLLVTIGTILILWFGGQMVLTGEMTLGELVAFNSYMLLLAMPAQQLGWLVNAGGEASAGVERTMEVLDHPPAIAAPPGAVALPRLAGRVTFDHVSFGYTGADTPTIEDIDLDVQPNQVVALIGPTGSGKTTVVNLIPRFYDPTAGSVRVDGHDVRSVDLVSLRRQVGIVLQTSLLFSATIRENIAYGRPEASEDEIVAAAKAAQAHDFIMEMPQGYGTVVGERGITLSGGQRQRVAIARALLIDPRILVLDDSTSSIDTQTEALIQRAMTTLMEGRTTFIIAQRLSTVRRADLILVMDHGRVIQRGTHAELLALPGLYRQIYDLQLRDQERFQDEMEALR